MKKPSISEIKTFLYRWVGKCEICKNEWNKQPHGQGSNLTVHRINRGCKGGEYIPRNCQVVCAYGQGNDCHKILHGGEGRRA